jgi:hypothetical protein
LLPIAKRLSHELRELRENNNEKPYFAKKATARNARTRKQQRECRFFVVFAQFVFLCCLPLRRCCFRVIRVIRGKAFFLGEQDATTTVSFVVRVVSFRPRV